MRGRRKAAVGKVVRFTTLCLRPGVKRPGKC